MPFQKKNQTRLTVLSVFMIFVLLLYAARMYSVQIIHAADYTDKNDGLCKNGGFKGAPRRNS